jgi:hypothetical protein
MKKMYKKIKRNEIYGDKLIKNVPYKEYDHYFHNTPDGNLTISARDAVRLTFVVEYMNKYNIKEFDYDDFDKTEELVNAVNNWLSKK